MDELIAQLLALAAFFAFPALQYVFLKWSSRRKGAPELWYLPAYGFRLVIANIGRKSTFSEIRYRAFIRSVVPAGPGSSVKTWMDQRLLEREDFFLFPGGDQVLLAFRLERTDAGNLVFVLTDKLGREESRHDVADGAVLVVDYSATLENFFNFDVRVAKRVEFAYGRLIEACIDVQKKDDERSFEPTRVRTVG